MSKAESAQQKPIAAFVGIDWADQKHDIVLRGAASDARPHHRSIASDPAALAEWVLEVQQQFAAKGRILVCLEQSRGALIHFLMGYECLELYPINPKQLASYREALRPSGAKDDPFDAGLLCQFLRLHHQQLRPWYPDDEQTRKLALLCEKRRQAVDTRTALSNQLEERAQAVFSPGFNCPGQRSDYAFSR
jgi:transposase